MRGKAVKLLKKASNLEETKYNELKKSWKGLSWIEKSKLRMYVESK